MHMIVLPCPRREARGTAKVIGSCKFISVHLQFPRETPTAPTPFSWCPIVRKYVGISQAQVT